MFELELLVCIKINLALNNLQWLICWWDKCVHASSKGINLKVNVIERLEFELKYIEAAGQHFSRCDLNNSRPIPNQQIRISSDTYLNVVDLYDKNKGNITPLSLFLSLFSVSQSLSFFVCLFVWVLWHINLCRLFNAKSILFKWTVLFQTIQFSLSTVSMAKTVLFQTFQLSISSQFSSIWPIDRNQKWTWGWWQWRGMLHSLKLQYETNLSIRLFNVISRTPIGWWRLTPLQKSSRSILQPQPTG